MNKYLLFVISFFYLVLPNSVFSWDSNRYIPLGGTPSQFLSGNNTWQTITSLTPGTNFTLNHNSVAAFTSVESGAVVDTLTLYLGKLGVGTSTPSVLIDAYLASNPQLRMTTAATGTSVVGRRSAGTLSYPSAVTGANANLASVLGYAYGTTTFNPCGSINIQTGEAQTDSTSGGQIIFYVTPTGSVTLVEKMRLTMAGFLCLGTTTAATLVDLKGADDTTVQTIRINATQANVTASDTFLDFRSSSGSEGSIAGTAVAGVIAYNTFTGAHYTHVVGEIPAVGMVMELTGDVIKGEEVDYLPISTICKTESCKKVYGIYAGMLSDVKSLSISKANKAPKDEVDAVLGGRLSLSPEYKVHQVFGLGTAVVLVSDKNGNIEAGDLLQADGDGFAEKQNDDIVRSSTIGKASVGVDWAKERVRVKLIGCLVYSG